MKKTLFLCMLGATLLVFGALVAGATDYDLSTRGQNINVATDSTLGLAIFHEFTVPDQNTVSSGSGVVDPFLSLQKKVLEEAFNSDFRPLVLDADRTKYNHSITFSRLVDATSLNQAGLPGVTLSNYWEFLLDINEPTGGIDNLLTLQALQVYIVPQADGGALGPNLSNVSGAAGSVKVYDLLANTIDLDYGLWAGSGNNIDLAFLLPKSAIPGGTAAGDFVYLYSEFGAIGPGNTHDTDGNWAAGDGFEEWVLRKGGQGFEQVPEPMSLILIGSGLAGASLYRRLRKPKN